MGDPSQEKNFQVQGKLYLARGLLYLEQNFQSLIDDLNYLYLRP